MKKTLPVGTRLYLVPREQRRDPYEMTITKVGRKWYTCGEGWRKERVHIEHRYVDGGRYPSPASAWLSKAEYDDHVALTQAWRAFAKTINDHNYIRPRSVTSKDQIEAALSLLGLG